MPSSVAIAANARTAADTADTADAANARTAADTADTANAANARTEADTADTANAADAHTAAATADTAAATADTAAASAGAVSDRAGAADAAAESVTPPAVRANTAQIRSAGVALTAEIGYGGYGQTGRPFPLLVKVASELLFRGELLIKGGRFVTSRSVEIPGGTTREFTIVMGAGLGWVWDNNVYVRLVADGQVVAEDRVSPVDKRGTDLVGVFPVLAGRGISDKAPLLFGTGEAALFPVDPAVLNAGWAGLEPLDIVVVTAADLRGLGDSGMDALLGWVNRGGRLLVDEPVGGEIPGVPAVWRPDGLRPRPAGQGEIAVTDGRAASDGWDAVLEPSKLRPDTNSNLVDLLVAPLGFTEYGRTPSLVVSITRYAGISLPGARWLGMIIAAYIAIAGPGVWLVSRALRRPGLCWILVPLVAVVFAVGIWTLGITPRSRSIAAHNTIMEVAPRGTVATTFSLLHSGSGSKASVSLPAGWSPVSVWDMRIDGESVNIADAGAGTVVSADVDASGFTIFGADGVHSEFDGTLQVTARAVGDGRTVATVINGLPVDLHEVAVFADGNAVSIGSVPAGQTAEHDYRDADAATHALSEVWDDVWSDEMTKPERTRRNDANPIPFSPGLWNEMARRWTRNAWQAGRITVAAWTDELASPIDAGITTGRTLLIAHGEVESDGDRPSEVDLPREIMRITLDSRPNLGADQSTKTVDVIFRFVSPEDADSRNLVLAVPTDLPQVELWTGTGWTRIGPADDTDAVSPLPPDGSVPSLPPDGSVPSLPPEEAVFPLPPEGIVADRVYLKASFDEELLFYDPFEDSGSRPIESRLRELSVRGRRSDDTLSKPSYTVNGDAA